MEEKMPFVPNRIACKVLGVHHSSLQKWAEEGAIKFIRTPSGHRRYDVEDFLRSKNSDQRRKVCYCRVSSRKQSDDLGRQVEFLRTRYPKHEIIEDIGSGLNFKRKGFIALLESVCGGNVEEIVVAHRDRLCRFGFELVQWLAERNNCKLVVLDADEKKSLHQELVEDLLSIITVFGCRINGLRKYRDKIKEDKDLPFEGTTDQAAPMDGDGEVCL
jgi:predicted site-specific integrase-resolvase